MRIAHCILEPRYSGAEILVLGLVRAQIAAGVTTALVALRPSEGLFEPELEAIAKLGCEILVPSKPLVGRQRLSWIRRATRGFRPDVLFAHSALPSVYSRIALIGVPGVSVVTVLHTDEDFNDHKLRVFERLMWRRNGAVVGVSPASIRNYRRLITEKQETKLIPNGVDFKSVRSSTVRRDEVRKQVYKAAPDEVILLQVGRISPQKGQRLSVEALAALGRSTSLENIRLVFAGIVEYKEYHLEVLAAAQALGVSNRIQFLGSRNDVPLLLAGADAHLMPSVWEAQGIVALEALASGIYCFFTPLESFSSFTGMPGVTILPEESDGPRFAGLLAQAIRTSATSQRYLRDMESYGFERCAREYLQVATSLISDKRRNRRDTPPA
jgi:glycosyltransferase involved in cell wall biosynthesis